MIRRRTNYRQRSNYDPRINRRKRRLGSIEFRLRRLKKHIDFDFDFDQYLGLPAMRVYCGPDTLYCDQHGRVILNDKIIKQGNFTEGETLFMNLIKRSFPARGQH